MLNPMPIGNMLFSTDKDLNNYFGIVFVSVDTSNPEKIYKFYPLLPIRINDRMYNPLAA
jgi:hypothetical protein